MKRINGELFVRFVRPLLGSLGSLTLLSSTLCGQAPPPPRAVIDERSAERPNGSLESEIEQVDAMEHLTRGPLHEAFAEPYEADPHPAPVVPNQPPEPINEVPPEYRPAGESVTWISGYWSWDDERSDFIWISGVWRDVPPDHQWVPGYWSRTTDGYQYIGGLWAGTHVAELEYLPPPPESLERGPSSPAPGDQHFYIPGNWIYSSNDYQWQPGFWSVNQENWVWIPAQYVWTPRGCIYQSGYWDYDIHDRGVVFTPVYYQQPVYRNTNYVYRPRYVVQTGLGLFVHLFVRPSYRQYYFGDYYGPRYATNYQPWSTYYQRPGYYDPFYASYRNRSQSVYRGQSVTNVNVLNWVSNQYQVFERNDRYRPAATISAQRAFMNANSNANMDQTVLRLASVGDSLDNLVGARDSSVNFVPLDNRDIERFANTAAPLRKFEQNRMRAESRQNANVDSRVSLREFSLPGSPANAMRRDTASVEPGATASPGPRATANVEPNVTTNPQPGATANVEPSKPAENNSGRAPRGDTSGSAREGLPGERRAGRQPTDNANGRASELGRLAPQPKDTPNAAGSPGAASSPGSIADTLKNDPQDARPSPAERGPRPRDLERLPGLGRDTDTGNPPANRRDLGDNARNTEGIRPQNPTGANRPERTRGNLDALPTPPRTGALPLSPTGPNTRAERDLTPRLNPSEAQTRPTMPENWPTLPRRELGRPVPNPPDFRNPSRSLPNSTRPGTGGAQEPSLRSPGKPSQTQGLGRGSTPRTNIGNRSDRRPSAAQPSASQPSVPQPSIVQPSAGTPAAPPASSPRRGGGGGGDNKPGKEKDKGKGKDKDK